jgi:hypothetical protein
MLMGAKPESKGAARYLGVSIVLLGLGVACGARETEADGGADSSGAEAPALESSSENGPDGGCDSNDPDAVVQGFGCLTLKCDWPVPECLECFYDYGSYYYCLSACCYSLDGAPSPEDCFAGCADSAHPDAGGASCAECASRALREGLCPYRNDSGASYPFAC